jgi:SpoVK/Ycf46/Vps4 family AAA+-type ATPase
MPKQLYIPLPCDAARRQLVERQLGEAGSVRSSLSEADIQKIVSKTTGYSGSDMKNLIQEACQGPVREAVMQNGAQGVLWHADSAALCCCLVLSCVHCRAPLSVFV